MSGLGSIGFFNEWPGWRLTWSRGIVLVAMGLVAMAILWSGQTQMCW